MDRLSDEELDMLINLGIKIKYIACLECLEMNLKKN